MTPLRKRQGINAAEALCDFLCPFDSFDSRGPHFSLKPSGTATSAAVTVVDMLCTSWVDRHDAGVTLGQRLGIARRLVACPCSSSSSSSPGIRPARSASSARCCSSTKCLPVRRVRIRDAVDGHRRHDRRAVDFLTFDVHALHRIDQHRIHRRRGGHRLGRHVARRGRVVSHLGEVALLELGALLERIDPGRDPRVRRDEQAAALFESSSPSAARRRS